MENSALKVLKVALVCLVLVFWPMLVGRAPAFGDNFSLLVPGKIFVANWLKQGVMPLWNPDSFAGISIVGDSTASLFYPSTWAFTILPPGSALNLVLVAHFLIGFGGMYLAAGRILRQPWSRLTTAVVWSLQPVFLGFANNLSIYQAWAWVPWLVWLAADLTRKKSQALFLLLIFIQFSAGYPQLVLLTLLACFWLRWQVFHSNSGWGWQQLPKEIGKWLGIGFVAVALTTVFWWPFLQELFSSTRVIQTNGQMQAGAIQPMQLVKLAWPHFFSNGELGYFWGPEWDSLVLGGVYLTGIGLALLAISLLKRSFSRREIGLLVGFGLALLLALGDATPFYHIWSAIPVLNFSRGPQHFFVVASLMFSFWLGLKLEQSYHWGRRWLIIARIATAGAVLLSLVMISWQIWSGPIWEMVNRLLGGVVASSSFHTLDRDYLIVSGILLDSWWLMVGMMGAAWLLAAGRLKYLPYLLALEMVWASSGQIWWARASLYSQAASQPLATQLKDALELNQYRVLIANYNLPYTGFDAIFQNMRRQPAFSQDQTANAAISQDPVELLANRAAGVTPNWHLASNFPSLTGFVALLPNLFNQQFNPQASMTPAINLLPEIKPDNPWLRHWSVGYYLVDTALVSADALTVLDSQFPLAADYDRWRVYQLPQTLTRFRYENYQPAEIEDLVETPNQQRFKLNNSKNRLRLLIADRFAPGWRAQVNDNKVELTDLYGLRSLPIEPGENEIVLTYQPLSLAIGFYVSLLAAILIVIWVQRPRWLKGLFLLPIWLLLGFAWPAKAAAAANQVTVINQVRGSECCDAGSLEATRNQLAIINQLNLPASFVIRPDALQDESWQTLWQDPSTKSSKIEWGLLLEITPELADKAGVHYLGAVETWHQAQHAFLLGYSPKERKLLADAAMSGFYHQFGHYPKLVAAWMLDSSTANYLQQQYGVSHIEITREQWGTDSYTLSGGWPHYPYLASRNWLLQPANSTSSGRGIIVLRQTVTDPLWNYGDRFSRFTSQPNDFTRDGKTFKYFSNLLEQSFSQPGNQRGWAVLGLENSMAASYQQLFANQLNWLAEEAAAGRAEAILASQVQPSNSAVNLSFGTDLVSGSDEQVAWISSSRYRVRLRWNQKKLWLDDLRIYDGNVLDPYFELPARSKGFWIVPFLLDGSRFYEIVDQKKFEKWQGGKVSPFDPADDVISRPQQLSLGSVAGDQLSWQVDDQGVLLTVGNKSLEFRVDTWQWQNWDEKETEYWQPPEWQLPIEFNKTDDGFQLAWLVDGEPAWLAVTLCQSTSCETQFDLDPTKIEPARHAFPELLFPEQLVDQPDLNQSQIYLHNPYLIAGQTPARVVLMPRSSRGIPVELTHPPSITLDNQQIEPQFNQSMLQQAVQFYDLPISEPGQYQLNVAWGDLSLQTQIKAAPNCRQQMGQCLKRPHYLFWYFKAWLAARFNQAETQARPWQTV